MTAPLDLEPSLSSPSSQRPVRAPALAPARPRFQAHKNRPTARIVAAVLVLAALAGAAFVKLRPAAVTTTAIVRGTAIDAVYATGTVEPFDRVIVKAKASGSVDLRVREGAHVKKGDLLATIDSPTLKHELARGRADLWAASQQAGANGPQLAALDAQARAIEAELNTARNDRERLRSLVASGSSPKADLDRIGDRCAGLESQLAANVAQRQALRIDLSARASGSSAAVESLASRLADAEVRAPMDGVVLARFVEPGEIAMINSPLLKIGTSDNLILECMIDEADIGKVSVGKKVAISLYAFPQAVHKGDVFEILPDADRAKKSFLTKVKFVDPPAGLRSGMTAEANVIIEERPDSLLLPAEAMDGSGTVLLVSDGRVRKRVPKLGVRDMLRVEVKDGLAEGDQVVVGGGEALVDGARVRATPKVPSEGAGAHGTRERASL